MRVYEPKEAAVAILERQLALNRREIASARASTQQQPGSNGVLGSASAGGSPGGHTRATEDKSAQARELYRMHRLHLLEQRKLRQQQRELSGSQQQQQQQQNGVLDDAALVRLLNGGLSQLGSPSEQQQQQVRPREHEHHQQEQEQRVRGEDPEEALDDTKTRLEAEVAMWKGKAETSLKSYRTVLHQAQAAHRKNLIQAVENNSLASERDEMEARNVAVVKELHETREALVEVKAELTTLKTLHARRHQHEQQQQHEQVHLQRQHQQQQQQQQQQRRRSSTSLHASPLRGPPASARQQRLRQERLTPQAEDPRTPTTTTTTTTTSTAAPTSPPPYNARDSGGGAASLLSSGAAVRRRWPETAGTLPTRTRPAAMFGRVSAPATVPMETRRQTTAEEAFATAGGGMAWSGSGEDGAGGEWGGDREGPAVPLPHEHGVPYWHPRASSAVALRRRLMEAGGERSKGSRGAAPAGVFLREDGFPVGDEGRQVAHPSSRDGGRDKRQQQLHEQQQPRHGYLHQRQQRRHSDTGVENRELWQEVSEERRPYGW